jgi:hypothetical protein
MILEMMQSAYLSRSSVELGGVLRELHDAVRTGHQPEVDLLRALDLAPYRLDDAIARLAAIDATLSTVGQDQPAYFPRDALTAQLQSSLQRLALSRGLTTASVPGPGAIDTVHPITNISLLDPPAPGDGLFGAMSQSDLRWVSCWVAKTMTAFGNDVKFPDQPAPPRRIAADARLFLVGDWGSGVSRARKISERIRSMSDAEPARDQHVIHLGDVYYSGWPEEYDDHFLSGWPVAAGKEGTCGSWSLNSNHDMFSRGSGYFGHLLKDSRFAAQAGSSHFSLENDDWEFLGLDSAFSDGTLAGSQFDWVEERRRKNASRKLVLMTHHQPFSAFEDEYPELWRLTARNDVTAWFWGHEHRFAIYEPRPDLLHGRLIGHGGVPVWAGDENAARPDGVRYLGTRAFRSGLDRFALFGFAVLDLDGPQLQVRYFDEHGSVEYQEVIA